MTRINANKIMNTLKAPPKQIWCTIESTREPHETMIETMVDPQDEEFRVDESFDEMSSYFRKEIVPKILMTTSDDQ
jgi:hypothetical protein